MKKYTVYRGKEKIGEYAPGELRELIKKKQVLPNDCLGTGELEGGEQVDVFLKRCRDGWCVKLATIAAGLSFLAMIMGGLAMSWRGVKFVPEVFYCMGIAFGVLSFLVFIKSRIAILVLVAFTAAALIYAMVDLMTKVMAVIAADVVILGGLLCIYIDATEAIFSYHKEKRTGRRIIADAPSREMRS